MVALAVIILGNHESNPDVPAVHDRRTPSDTRPLSISDHTSSG